MILQDLRQRMEFSASRERNLREPNEKNTNPAHLWLRAALIRAFVPVLTFVGRDVFGPVSTGLSESLSMRFGSRVNLPEREHSTPVLQ